MDFVTELPGGAVHRVDRVGDGDGVVEEALPTRVL